MLKLLTALATLILAASSQAEELAGYDRLSFKPAHRAETVAASVWYPVGTRTYRGLIGDNPVFVGTYAMVGAAPQGGKHPLVVLSHGSGGNMDGLGWLSSELAKSGAIVLGLNHPGSTSGDSSPRRSILDHERAEDLSAALDMILADPTFGPLVDRDHVSALGFSLGGATVMATAGARFDREAYKAYCKRLGVQATDCVFFAKGGVDLDHLPAEVEKDLTDKRFASFVAVDPGFTYAFTDESLQSIERPTLLINLGDKGRLPAGDLSANGSNFIARLPHSQYTMFQPANHFTFLGLCKPGARELLEKEGEDPICDEPAGTDRAAIHARIIARVKTFLEL